MKKLSFSLLAASLAFLATSNFVFAQGSEFTSCLTPSGDVKADFPDGSHGIVGNGQQEGHDTVYEQSEGNSMQCFCGENGSGTQTNWLKSSGLSEDQIKVYQSQGWIFVPDGSAWGLTEESYLAQNLSYSCSGSNGGSSETDGKTDGLTDGRSDGRGSVVQAATGNNLATTGNIIFVLSILGTGVFMVIAGLWLRKNTN